MSQDLFEINRNSLKKIFETHQIRGTILFTDILKICTATRIFPNLLTSKDLRKLIIQVTNVTSGDELSAKLSFEEMEEFLRGVAEHSYPARRGAYEQYRMLFLHMRNPCYLRYNIILDTEERLKKKQDSEKVTVKTSHGVFFRPSSEKSLLSVSPYRTRMVHSKIGNLNTMISPKVNNSLGFSLRLQEESSRDSSAQPSPKVLYTDRPHENYDLLRSTLNRSKESIAVLPQVTEAFVKFKERSQNLFIKDKRIGEKEIKIMLGVRNSQTDKQVKLLISFNLWKSS